MAGGVTARSPITESSIRATVRINNDAKSQEWEMASGGAKSSRVTKVRVGYDPETVVTVPSVSDSGPVTVTRHMVVSEAWALQSRLLSLVGVGTADIWMTPMNTLGAADYGAVAGVVSMVYSGLITDVTPVSANNEGTGVAQFSMTVTGSGWHDAA